MKYKVGDTVFFNRYGLGTITAIETRSTPQNVSQEVCVVEFKSGEGKAFAPIINREQQFRHLISVGTANEILHLLFSEKNQKQEIPPIERMLRTIKEGDAMAQAQVLQKFFGISPKSYGDRKYAMMLFELVLGEVSFVLNRDLKSLFLEMKKFYPSLADAQL